jgi:uncharacterized C2H2 Zn-finger protein
MHSDKGPKFACTECGKFFASEQGLKLHVASQHSDKGPKFTCIECGIFFASRQSFKLHVASQHSDKGPKFACNECGKFFASEQSLKLHVASQHSNKGPKFACNECGQFLSSEQNLKLHVASLHLYEKNYTCENCGFEIFKYDSFKKHQLVCTGGKKWSSMEDKVMAVLADLGIERTYKHRPPSASSDVAVDSFDHPTYQFDELYKVRSINFLKWGFHITNECSIYS